jgi:hypothetical protein
MGQEGSNTGLIVGIIIAVIIVILGVVALVVVFTVYKEKETPPIVSVSPMSNTREYKFIQGVDSPGNDIKHDSASTGNETNLKLSCDKTAGCVGVTTSGFLKNKIYGTAQLNRYTSDPASGLYVLSSYTPATA